MLWGISSVHGGCSVLWRTLSAVEDYISTVEGYHQCCYGYSILLEWRMVSNVVDFISTVWDTNSTLQDVQYYMEWRMLSALGRSIQYCGASIELRFDFFLLLL